MLILCRNADKANAIIREVESTSDGGKCHFIKADISLLKTVDEVCLHLQGLEERINILFLTAGFMTLRGRSGKSHKKCTGYIGTQSS